MAKIDIWKCDICGAEFRDGDSGYSNCYEVNICIEIGICHGKEVMFYKDTCLYCRQEVSNAARGAIRELRGKCGTP